MYYLYFRLSAAESDQILRLLSEKTKSDIIKWDYFLSAGESDKIHNTYFKISVAKSDKI